MQGIAAPRAIGPQLAGRSVRPAPISWASPVSEQPKSDALDDTYEVERSKWDAFADREFASAGQPGYLPTFAEFVSETPSWAKATEFVGDLRGARVLEYGCGVGYLAAILAREGALVSAFDLSERSVAVTRHRLQANELSGEISVAAGEDLPYASDSFDIVIGTSVLHHLEVSRAAPELYRVLRPGGRGTFLEPMGMNPLLNFARDHLYYRQKTDRGADHPLTYQDLEAWGRGASRYTFREGQLVSMVERFFGWDTHFHRLHRVDAAVLARVRPLRRYARQVAIYIEK